MLFHLPLRHSFLLVSYLANHNSSKIIGLRTTTRVSKFIHTTTTTTTTRMATPNNASDDDDDVVPTQGDKLKEFYGSETATMYAGMMEDEMVKYTDDFDLVFQRLQTAFPNTNDHPSTIKVLDTCCGSGHMLKYIGEKLRDASELKGIDLSPDMLAIAQSMVPGTQKACLQVGNMLDMSNEPDHQYHLVLNNFAMHHATAQQAEAAIQEYARLLIPKGCLFFSAWEGTGKIDYGDMDFDANYHSEADMKRWITETAGLTILKCRSFVEKEMGDMNSVYFVAQKPG